MSIRDTELFKNMTVLDAIDIVEVNEEASDEAFLAACQWLHDTGTGYQLQGWYGRTLTALLNSEEIEA